ncbi:hypothetical protein SAMN05443574_1391 [Haloarcula vallismortis]|uniref:SHOCT domain-containing protein n=2 Tax=Haloarcula vallismortis TaxID=28442 RepID=M0JNN1_HALVA|nr:hypothetical protein [Haloarcula vallismortis]EMA09549.1 hypothetical protein C437_05460 [Haloarcula vallismortis ATCC 29715]SDX37509.1 hypothetical protein SAMN05443574_1391 [Haloarcula vallismortis]
MTDVEDLVEAVVDIEDIVEEIADPDDLIEDFVANPLMILFAFTAALAGLFLLCLFVLTLILLVLAFGPVEVLVLLMILSFVVFAGSVGAFLYVRTDIPSDVYHKINNALEQADDSPETEGAMTETEAIEELKNQYAAGNLDDYELEQALDDALTSENPADIVERYTETDREMERE